MPVSNSPVIVLPALTGGQAESWSALIEIALSRELAGIERQWRLDDLRHCSAGQSIASGQDVRTVANRLGHADPAMTLPVYAQAVERADEALAQILGSTLDG